MSFISKIVFRSEFAGCGGAEEEHWTVDADGRLIAAAPLVFQVINEGEIRPELPVHQIEVVTGICRSGAEIARDLSAKRARLAELGGRFGFRTNTSPVPPHHDFQVEVYPKPRYLEIAARVPAEHLKAGWITGLHVHVGCDSIGQAILLLNGLREFLPLFMSAAAIRPLPSGNGYHGRASERFFSYCGMQPNLVPPHVLGSEHLEELAQSHGFAEDPRRCWWAVRINPHGTVEVRIFDMQETAEHSGQLAALVLVLSRMILRSAVGLDCADSSAIMERLTAAATDHTERRQYTGRMHEVLAFARRDYAEEASQVEALIQRVFT